MKVMLLFIESFDENKKMIIFALSIGKRHARRQKAILCFISKISKSGKFQEGIEDTGLVLS